MHAGHRWRVFRRAEGCPPSICVQRLRCRYVLERLAGEDGRTALAELALDAGFADQSHLTRVFRRTLGTSPSVLRSGLRRLRSGKAAV